MAVFQTARKYSRWTKIISPLVIILVYYVLKHIPSLTDGDSSKPFLSTTFDIPGFGNLMFQYASVYGISVQSKRSIIVPQHFVLLKYFKLQAHRSRELRPGAKWGKLVERHSNRHDQVLADAASTSTENLEMVGYFQSWKYFIDSEKELRDQFIFNEEVNLQIDYIKKLSDIFNKTDKNTVTVGVHVRRTDMLTEPAKDYGYTVADVEYLEKAMNYFENQFANLRFVVTSDDINWCVQNINTDRRYVWFSRRNHAMVDLALLSSCDHVIMTVGTFGWWAGWLSGGQVLYFKNFPRKGSRLEKAFSASKLDYYPPGWVGL